MKYVCWSLVNLHDSSIRIRIFLNWPMSAFPPTHVMTTTRPAKRPPSMHSHSSPKPSRCQGRIMFKFLGMFLYFYLNHFEIEKWEFILSSSSLIFRSRKRRTSETLLQDDEEVVMSECSAAMLLMKLSCSPHQTQYHSSMVAHSHHQYGSSLPIFDSLGKPMLYGNLPSPVDSSGASSFRSATPSPPLSSSTGTSMADEGIVKDIFTSEQTRSRSNSKPVSR